MSCEQYTKAYEASLEKFWELLDNYDFHSYIYEHFLDSGEQFLEKENGRVDEYVYENVFERLWNWDCESMYHDIKYTIKQYVERRNS